MESNGERFLIRQLSSEDVEEVAKLVSKVFTEREPVLSYLNFGEEMFYSNIGKHWVEECVKEGMSFVCLDTTLKSEKQIVGFRLSETLKRQDVAKVNDENDNFNVLDAIDAFITEWKNLWFEKHDISKESVDAPKCLLFLALGVKEEYENYGIASKLIKYSLNHAKLKGYDYVYVIASAPATQHMFQKKFTFTELFSKFYRDIEYKGHYFLKGITNPAQIIAFEFNLKNWDSNLHGISNLV